MQCIWTSVPTASGNLLRTHPKARCVSALLGWTQRRSLSTRLLKSAKVDPDKYTALASTFVHNMLRDTSAAPTPHRICDELDPEERRNAARLSRIAAQSVRLGCKDGNVKEAMIIIKALQKSVGQYGNGGSAENQARPDVAIDFGQAVSPRLALHALLHGLVRLGMTKKAGELVRTLLHSNTRLHQSTLRLVTKKLCETDVKALRDEGFRGQLTSLAQNFKTPSNNFMKTVARARSPCTDLAVDLFFVAKQYQRKRAKQMFQQLIDACLLQGEILVLTFLFAFLMIRWQCRKASNVAEALVAEALDQSEQTSEGVKTLAKYKNLLHFWFNPQYISTENSRWLEEQKLPSPNGVFVNRIMALVNAAVFDAPLPNPEAIRPSFEEAAQALAVLASMLKDGILAFDRSSAVIAALVYFPSEPSVKVWSFHDGEKRRYPARHYFDQVLDGLVENVRSNAFGTFSAQGSSVGSCNALLQYTLHRKLSPAKGAKLFNWMLKTGGAVKPNIVSYNTLLRSAIQLRRDDIASKVLAALRQRPENHDHAIMFVPEQDDATESLVPCLAGNISKRSLFDGAKQVGEPPVFGDNEQLICRDIDLAGTSVSESPNNALKPEKMPGKLPRSSFEEFDVDFHLSGDAEIRANNTTLTIYLAFLTSTGRPHIVKDLVYFLIPELEVMDKPLPYDELHKVRSLRIIALRRAIALGPFFFTVVVNALCKVGRTEDAEQVWLLAKRAEKFSWHSQYAEVSTPWVLPIAAHTSMLQCYTREARGALKFVSSGSMADGDGFSKIVRRWGRFARELVERKEKGRSISVIDASRGMGIIVFRSVHSRGRMILENLGKEKGKLPQRRTLELPVPDERFFNAALDLFGRVPASYIRQPLFTKEEWERLNRDELEHHLQTGRARLPQDPILVDIVRSMHEAGYEVPLAFKRFLYGSSILPLSITSTRRKRRPPSPYGTWISKFTPYSHPTSKSRGLPLRRRQWKHVTSNSRTSYSRPRTTE